MKINMKKFKKMQNKSIYYADWDQNTLKVFDDPSLSSSGKWYTLFSPNTPKPYCTSKLFHVYFDESGMSIDLPYPGVNDFTKINLFELKEVVKYVSEFYKRLYDNDFLVSEENTNNHTTKKEGNK